MPRCDVCGNDYDKAFQVTAGGATHTFDSFECAIYRLAPACEHCGCKIVGHGVEAWQSRLLLRELRAPLRGEVAEGPRHRGGLTVLVRALAVAAAGAGLMYPARSRRWSAPPRAHARSARPRRPPHGDAVDSTSRDVGNRARGVVAELRGRLASGQVDDGVLHERVRARIGTVVGHASSSRRRRRRARHAPRARCWPTRSTGSCGACAACPAYGRRRSARRPRRAGRRAGLEGRPRRLVAARCWSCCRRAGRRPLGCSPGCPARR